MKKRHYLSIENGVAKASGWYAIYPSWIKYYLSDNEFAMMAFFFEMTQNIKALSGNILIIENDIVASCDDIAKMIGGSRRTVQRHCTSLEATGLIVSKRTRYEKSYSVNYQLIERVTKKYGNKPNTFWIDLRSSNPTTKLEVALMSNK